MRNLETWPCTLLLFKSIDPMKRIPVAILRIAKCDCVSRVSRVRLYHVREYVYNNDPSLYLDSPPSSLPLSSGRHQSIQRNISGTRPDMQGFLETLCTDTFLIRLALEILKRRIYSLTTEHTRLPQPSTKHNGFSRHKKALRWFEKGVGNDNTMERSKRRSSRSRAGAL